MKFSFQSASILLLVFKFTLANFTASCEALRNNCDNMKSLLDHFSASDGLEAAINIQTSLVPIIDSTNSLTNVTRTSKADDVKIDAVEDLVISVTALVDTITFRLNEFQQLGVKDYAAQTITLLDKPTLDAVSGIIQVTKNDCNKTEALNPSLEAIEISFTDMYSAYGLPKLTFPTNVTCSHGNSTSKAK